MDPSPGWPQPGGLAFPVTVHAPNRIRLTTLCLIACLVAGFSLRFGGLTRGDSTFVVSGKSQSEGSRAFYHFHPDETTLIKAALGPIDPLAPGLTSYGTLPVYLLRGVLEFKRIVLGIDFKNQESPDDVRYVYITARLLAVLISCLTLYLVWLLGARWFGELTGLLAVFIVAIAPLAVQLAHFYTVDGLFTLLVLAAVYSLLNALEKDNLRWFILAGALAGLSGAVRMIGLAVGLLLLAGLVVRDRQLKAVLSLPLWISGMAAVLCLLALQPFLLTNWELFFQVGSPSDLGYSMKVARGELLKPWSLWDVHTVPYLYHWSHLLPLGVGWPLTILFALGIFYGLWKLDLNKSLILLWIGFYFAVIGGLHTKPIRYLLPLLPFMALLAGDLCLRIVRSHRFPRVRKLAVGVCAGVLVYSAVYGVAFAGLYTREDSRIQAARWIDGNIPARSRIGVERGGFSMQRMIASGKHHVRVIQAVTLFNIRGYATCNAELDWLQEKVNDLDYLVITDVNRYQQFTAAPDLVPGGSAFYWALVEGELGFDLVQRFRNYPSLGAMKFKDDGSEPSFTGYDHPTVMIFQKKDKGAFEQGLERLRKRVRVNPYCPDPLLEAASSALQTGNLNECLQATARATSQLPQSKIAPLMEAEIYRRMGRSNQGVVTVPHTGQSPPLVLWAGSMSFFELGLPGLAVTILKSGVRQISSSYPGEAGLMSRYYYLLADRLYDRGQKKEAAEVLLLSIEIQPLPPAFNRLGKIAVEGKEYEQAVKYFQQSLQLDADQTRVHTNLGQITAKFLQQPTKALHHFRTAFQLDPKLKAEYADWISALEKQPGSAVTE